MPIKFTDLDPNPMERLLQTCKQLSLVVLKIREQRIFNSGVLKSMFYSQAQSRGRAQAQKAALCTKRRGWDIGWGTQTLRSLTEK